MEVRKLFTTIGEINIKRKGFLQARAVSINKSPIFMDKQEKLLVYSILSAFGLPDSTYYELSSG